MYIYIYIYLYLYLHIHISIHIHIPRDKCSWQNVRYLCQEVWHAWRKRTAFAAKCEH